MQAAAAARRPRVLTEIDPHSEWVHGRELDAIMVDVTGFSKDQLKVLVEPWGSLKVSGDQGAVDGGGGMQRRHFTKRFDLPAGCDVAAITVQLDEGMLYIQVPRPAGAAAAWWGTEQQQQPAEEEVYEDAVRGVDETGDDAHGGGLAVRRDGGHHPLMRRLARGLSRHRQVVLNVVLAVVLLWLVAFTKHKPGGGQAMHDG